MKAAILEKGVLAVKDVPKPVPEYEQALIKMTTSGICHSDLHLVRGDWPRYVTPYPMPMGHEGIGVVKELGPNAEKFVKEGDRVILGLGGAAGAFWCGACEYCLGGKPRLCRQARGLIGTYAEYISVWAKALVKLPDSIGDNEVSLACGGLTSYSAIKKLVKFGVIPGKPIAIVGAAGGLGHYAIQIAKAFGYIVVGVDVGQEKMEFIKSMGADVAVDASEAKQVVKDKFIGVNGTIVLAPKVAGFELGLDLLIKNGVCVVVGMPAASDPGINLHPLEILRKDTLIMGSSVGTVQDMRELIQMAAAGKVKTHISRKTKLSEVNKIFEELEQAKYTGRAIITNMLE